MSSYHLRIASNNESAVSFELPEEVVVSLEGMVDSFMMAAAGRIIHVFLNAGILGIFGGMLGMVINAFRV